jgi:hypothetical protein
MSKPTKQFKTLHLPGEDFDRIKTYCALNGRIMSSWVGKVTREAIAHENLPTVSREALSARLDTLTNPRSVPKENSVTEGEVYCEEVKPQGLE